MRDRLQRSPERQANQPLLLRRRRDQVDCSDSLCSTGGWLCTDLPAAPSCCGDGLCSGIEDSDVCGLDCPVTGCGDGSCDPGETSCSCGADCGAPPTVELFCADGSDDDCDGIGACGSCSVAGDGCTLDDECCSGKCKGKPGSKTCK